MPNHASSKKALRVSHRKRTINTRATEAFKSEKLIIKKKIQAGDVKTAKTVLNSFYAKVDAAVKKEVIHANKGSRLKARAAAAIKKADTSAK